MKAFEYYTNYGSRPRSNDFTKYYVYHKGAVIANGIVNPDEDLRADWRAKGYKIETEKDEGAYRAAGTVYFEGVKRLKDEFKADLFAEFDVSGPKAEKALKIAEDERSGAGLHEVYDLFSDLVELIK